MKNNLIKNNAIKKITILLMLPMALVNFAQAETGENLYQYNCAQCHGKNREGAVGPSLVDNIWLHGEPTKANLINIITKGIPDKAMPGWASTLSAENIALISDYLLTKSNVDKSTVNQMPELSNLKLPNGFTISVYADKVENARSMAVADNGIVYVGSRVAGKVYAVVDENKDKVADKVITVAENLNAPIGVTLLNGSLYVAEISRVIKFDNIAKTYNTKPKYKIIKDDFPTDKWHGQKIIKAGPDGKIYIPIGAPCNVCDREDEVYSKIWRMNPDGSDFEIYASGVRNTVGFAWHPTTKEMWFTDNGRDEMGDNIPSCELNHAPKAGMHFGFPYCHSGVVPDPEFGKLKSCDQFVPPAAHLGPHVAPLGLHFYTGKQFPAQYQQNIFVAEHGSWNRTRKIGYRVNLITLGNSKVVSDTPFIEGFLQDEKVIGRPVDIAQMDDGSMLISDDLGGRLYRVSYK